MFGGSTIRRTSGWCWVPPFLSAVLAYATGEAAGRRGDARLLYVSLAFLSSAGFLALHALATPGVLLGKSNTGFTIATPVGVAIGSVFAALSTRDFLAIAQSATCDSVNVFGWHCSA